MLRVSYKSHRHDVILHYQANDDSVNINK